MRYSIAVLLVLAGLVQPSASAAGKPARWRGVWKWSQALLVGANTADIASSWGKREANPLLRTGPRFCYASAAIKLGALTGILTAQHFMLRKSERQIPYYTSANLAATAALALATVRNTRVTPPR